MLTMMYSSHKLKTVKIIKSRYYPPSHHPGVNTLLNNITSSTRSSASHLLSVPQHNISFGSRTFRISEAAPEIWNSIPPHILQSQTLSLKTHYFQSAYSAP